MRLLLATLPLLSLAPACEGQEIGCGEAALHANAHASCEAMDAKGTSGLLVSCPCILGFKWSGESCMQIGGCSCVGEDCDKLTATEEACLIAHQACLPYEIGLACGDEALHASPPMPWCEPSSAQAIPDSTGESCDCVLGWAWDGSDCAPLTNCRCLGWDCERLAPTRQECLVAHFECVGRPECSYPRVSIRDGLHQGCAPMDAAAAPLSDDPAWDECRECVFGYAWTGSECAALQGCDCWGADCRELFYSLEECQAMTEGCVSRI